MREDGVLGLLFTMDMIYEGSTARLVALLSGTVSVFAYSVL
jgi:hypothetical protein